MRFMLHLFRVARLPLLAAACLLGAGLTNPAFAEIPTTDYHIHPGDKILIGLYDDPKMQPVEITVAPDGKLAFPLIGVISAGGKTVDQLRVEMETKLKKFVSEPVVTVAVTQVLGNVAYVIGQVNKPGSFIMNPTINVLQALALACGGNPYAKMDGIIIIRSSPGGQRVLNFRYG